MDGEQDGTAPKDIGSLLKISTHLQGFRPAEEGLHGRDFYACFTVMILLKCVYSSKWMQICGKRSSGARFKLRAAGH